MSRKNISGNKKPAASHPIISHAQKATPAIPWYKNRWVGYFTGGAIAVMILGYTVFLPARTNGYVIKWDDDQNITDEHQVMSDSFRLSMLFTPIVANIIPVTRATFRYDYLRAGKDPQQLHETSIRINAINGGLAFCFSALFAWMLSCIARKNKVSIWTPDCSEILGIAFLAGSIWVIHPMHVESVAWISARKDLVYTFFYLLSMIHYLLYLKTTSRKRYLFLGGTFIFFVLSLGSKAMSVTLPVVLLIFDILFNRSLKERMMWLEKIPFFAVAYWVGQLAIKTQMQDQAVNELAITAYATDERWMFGCYALIIYIKKFIVATSLSAFYGYPAKLDGKFDNTVYYSPFLAGAYIGSVIVFAGKFPSIRKVLLFGNIFFVLNVILILQIWKPIGGAIAAERYTYLAYLGFSLSIAYVAFYLLHVGKTRSWLKYGIITSIFCFGFFLASETIGRIPVWKNATILWGDAARDPLQYFAHYKFARSLEDDWMKKANSGNDDTITREEILQHLDVVITYKPQDPDALSSRAVVLKDKGLFKEALSDINESLSLEFDTNSLYTRIGIYLSIGEPDLARADIDTYKNRTSVHEFSEVPNLLGINYAFRSEKRVAEGVSLLNNHRDKERGRRLLELGLMDHDSAWAYGYKKDLNYDPKKIRIFLGNL